MGQDELFYKLMYPPMTSVREFVDALPNEVVNRALVNLHKDDKYPSIETKRMYLRIMLRQEVNRRKASDAIWSALRIYHNIQP